MKITDKDRVLWRKMVRQIGEMILTDPTTGDLCLISSTMKDNAFIATNPRTGVRWRHTIQTEELRANEPGTRDRTRFVQQPCDDDPPIPAPGDGAEEER